jgi:CAAX protease family protein
MHIKAFVQKHSIAAYFVLALAISWCASLLTLGPKFLAGEPLLMADALPGLVGMMLGPSLSGIVLTWIVDGKPGLQALFSRMGRWNVGLRWWAAALLLFPGLLLIVLLLLAGLISPAYLPGFEILGIAYGLFAGFFEETGWTGFAVPRMQRKFGALTAGVLLGLIHGIWHIVADFMGSSGALGSYWFIHFAALWVVGLIAFRIIMIWVYNNTGSVLLAQLMHASFSGSLITLTPRPIIPANETFWYVIFALAVWAAAAVVIVGSHRRLARPVVAPA